ncbi:glycosyltransferase family 2 protein [Leptospira barantonii]|uniref:Glycosyltransferase family 2 protein n=1 Tax=Leptospira barantonii TaxID=2023184 RepID=A0A5F2B1M9_9LEPT|nr:glycosyltransferase family 2 protein [Leptospira barantonii]TGL98136.1 glycosyltransferase family 2 protein [Leptospira barantonii]
MSERFSPLAVIVTFNPDFSNTLRNIQNLNSNEVPVLIVDNHSSNLQEIKSNKQKRNFLLENDRNLGLGFALNKGIEYAKENRYSHVWLFDQDSFLESESIRIFLDVVQKYETVPGVQSKVASFGPNIFDKVKDRNIYGLPENAVGLSDAKFLITSGSLCSLKILNEVGWIRSDFFIDYLDYEWCFRANNKGYVHKIVTESKMSHSIGNESRNILGLFKIAIHSPFRWYFLFRNGILMCRLPHVPMKFKLEVILKSGFRFSILPFFSKSVFGTYVHILHGIWDGLTQKESSFYRRLVGLPEHGNV